MGTHHPSRPASKKIPSGFWHLNVVFRTVMPNARCEIENESTCLQGSPSCASLRGRIRRAGPARHCTTKPEAKPRSDLNSKSIREQAI